MKFNHKIFFDGFKEKFDSSLDQDQTNGIEFLLTSFETYPQWKDVRHIAYAFATTFHETNGSMQPVEEGYYLIRYGAKRVKDFQASLRYYPWFGRGYVQLTWNTRKIPNYSKANKQIPLQMPELVERFESETGQKFDLIAHPEQALNKHIAFAVMTLGMFQGWFTSKKLSDFIHGSTCNYFDSRTIINGHDVAGKIERFAERFEKLLRSALIDSGSQTAMTEEKVAEASLDAETALESQQTSATDISAATETPIGIEAATKTSVLSEADSLGNKVQSINQTVEKFQLPTIPSGIGTKLSVFWKQVILPILLNLIGFVTGHWEICLIVTVIIVGLGTFEWIESRRRNNPLGAIPPEMIPSASLDSNSSSHTNWFTKWL